jgi:stage II sporulation protein R
MVIGLLPVHGESAIYDNVLRLHVIANSNSEADQSLKLLVRDKIIGEVSTLVADCKSFEDAERVLSKKENLDKLQKIAEGVVAAEGYDYKVSVSLGREKYPRKSYEALCFPSGKYTSLRVEIGSAVGKNWWCVLFPQLCLDAASSPSNEDSFIEAGFTPEQYKIVTETDQPRYEVKFKLLEIIEETFGE